MSDPDLEMKCKRYYIRKNIIPVEVSFTCNEHLFLSTLFFAQNY